VVVARVLLFVRWQACRDRPAVVLKFRNGFLAMVALGGLGNLVAVLGIYTQLPPQTGALVLLIMVGALAVAALYMSLVSHSVAIYMLPGFLAALYVGVVDTSTASLAIAVVLPVYIAINLRAARDNQDRAIALMHQRIELERTAHALEAARLHADAANRAKSQFLANMSHEIRTPMNGVMGSLELLADGTLDTKRRRWLEVARSSGAGLLSVINDVLDYSKLEAGKLRFVDEHFDIRATVHNAASLFGATAQQKSVALKVEIDPQVPRMVIGDGMRVGQVLLNLIGNAVKFTDKGEISVRVFARESTVARVRLRFEIRDTGVGVPRELQARVFEPFYQLDNSDAREHQGAGLGLAISRQIVENLGGEINLYSEPGQGATFGVTLGFGATSQQVAEDDEDALRTGQRLSLRLHEAGVRRVLVAEDNAFNRLIITNMLETLPLEVEEVEDGAAALARWRGGSFDAILLDCNLPELTGFEVAERIRNEEATRGNGHTLIIAVTAYALAGDRERCLAAGMDEYLPKPFTAAQLRKALTQRAA